MQTKLTEIPITWLSFQLEESRKAGGKIMVGYGGDADAMLYLSGLAWLGLLRRK